MDQATVEYRDGEFNLTILVQQATVRMGWSRAGLTAKFEGQLKSLPADQQTDLATRYTVFRTMPELLGATISIKNNKGATKKLDKDVSLQEWFDLPEALVMAWEQAVYKLNPHWVIKTPEEQQQGEAQEPGDNSSLTNGSSPG